MQCLDPGFVHFVNPPCSHFGEHDGEALGLAQGVAPNFSGVGMLLLVQLGLSASTKPHLMNWKAYIVIC